VGVSRREDSVCDARTDHEVDQSTSTLLNFSRLRHPFILLPEYLDSDVSVFWFHPYTAVFGVTRISETEWGLKHVTMHRHVCGSTCRFRDMISLSLNVKVCRIWYKSQLPGYPDLRSLPLIIVVVKVPPITHHLPSISYSAGLFASTRVGPSTLIG
jgi:hypothetical protein